MARPPVTPEEILRIAELALLELAEDEARQMAAQLESILSFFEQLQELDTTGVEPGAHLPGLTARLRDDEPRPSLEARAALNGAPASESGHFKVPRVI